jgi:hypothetical protein
MLKVSKKLVKETNMQRVPIDGGYKPAQLTVCNADKK